MQKNYIIIRATVKRVANSLNGMSDPLLFYIGGEGSLTTSAFPPKKGGGNNDQRPQKGKLYL